MGTFIESINGGEGTDVSHVCGCDAGKRSCCVNTLFVLAKKKIVRLSSRAMCCRFELPAGHRPLCRVSMPGRAGWLPCAERGGDVPAPAAAVRGAHDALPAGSPSSLLLLLLPGRGPVPAGRLLPPGGPVVGCSEGTAPQPPFPGPPGGRRPAAAAPAPRAAAR